MNPIARLHAFSDFKPDEQLYLKFMYDAVNQKIVNKASPIFLAANEEEHGNFLTFIKKNYKDHLITDPNYSVRKTLHNVWKVIKNHLNEVLEPDTLKNENHCQYEAYRDTVKQGQLGKVLTLRQAKVFILYAQNVEISHCKKLIGQPLSPFTPDEKLYLKFVVTNVRNSLKEKCNLIFLGASEKMQIDFISFAREKKVNYTRKNLNFLGIINAITYRAQTELNKTIDPMFIEEESRQQKFADEEFSALKKICKGRMLTKRQAEILIEFAK